MFMSPNLDVKNTVGIDAAKETILTVNAERIFAR